MEILKATSDAGKPAGGEGAVIPLNLMRTTGGGKNHDLSEQKIGFSLFLGTEHR